ncbi:MAG: CopD family protein [Ferrovum sp.]|nr:CopD family protein [Ferrovum sp.]NDU87851.1 CopD family protein [Ferrovum sp.]
MAMVTWFAGLFYLPRLFVYHAQCPDNDTLGHERFKIMERKLFWGITTPGGILTVASGLFMAFGLDDRGGWLMPKLTLVTLLVGYHGWCGILVKAFAQNRNSHSHVWYRWFNEFPVLILIPVVILVVFKPF